MTMGPLGMPELIIILLVLVGLVAVPAIIIAVILAAKRSGSPPAPSGNRSVEIRLAEVESLRARNVITDEEYQEKRKQIIGKI